MKFKLNNVSSLSIPVFASNFPEISHDISILLVESASIQKSHNFGEFLKFKAGIISIESLSYAEGEVNEIICLISLPSNQTAF